MPTGTNIIELRQLLRERHPTAFRSPEERSARLARWPTGVPEIDHLLDGGLPRSAITELVSPQRSAGSAAIVASLLRRTAAEQTLAALVDGQDSFDPAALGTAAHPRLLWVRCGDTAQALKAADLLLRDGNLPLVILDLRLNPATDLRRIAGTAWYRFSRLVEGNQTALLVVSPLPMVSSACARLVLESRLTLAALSADVPPGFKLSLALQRAAQIDAGARAQTAKAG